MKNGTLLRSFLSEQRPAFAWVLLLEFCGSALTLLLPLLIAQAYADIFEFQSMRGRMLQKFGWQVGFSPNWLLILSIAILGKAGFDYARKCLKGFMLERYLVWLRHKLFAQHLRMSAQEYEKSGTSKYLMRFSGDLGSAQQLLGKGVLQFFADASLLFLGVLLMLVLNRQLGLLMLGCSVLMGVIIARFNLRIEQLEERRRDSKAGLLAFVNQRLSHIYTIKALNRERPEQQLFNKRVNKIQDLGRQYQQQVALLSALIPFFIYVLLLLVLGAAYFWKKQGIPFPQDVLFALILILLTWKPVLSRVMQIGLVWKKGGISLRKMANLLEKPLERGHELPEKRFQPTHLRVDLTLLSPAQKTEACINFQLQRGEQLHLRLEEPQQNTLLNTLAALTTPIAGSLELDDVSFTQLHPKDIRRQFAFVSPLFPLYGKNVLEAIAYSRKHYAKAEQLLAEWQQLFPDLQSIQPDTPLTERAMLTSTQLQLLQWMRAFLTHKPFMVLHDPYRLLSPIVCQQLQQLLQQHQPKTGILNITSMAESGIFIEKKARVLR
ncbi:ABC transporter transmembrane domain-containing protein [Haliscomenobacter hydrossis]|uniref:ABC transporter transmembrane region n=1 Tax=Haliscomenobacter hydrossis (strain ATCC 27775 / DSM 1100 / LMG 10767 / O) TaxID=760192 RepID=F4L4F8_HALH1|nr:ABC transporter transmembrane domain-containing protein [Haliscomenobacter hydrossis]AEE51827.1 ABC transporter transmembrane region [Haliscomenobacter hydrossis DSM 1100]